MDHHYSLRQIPNLSHFNISRTIRAIKAAPRQIEPRGAEKSEPIAPADDGAQSQGAEPR